MQWPRKIFAGEKLAPSSRLRIALLISLIFHVALLIKTGQLHPGVRNDHGLQITLIESPGKAAARAEISAPGEAVSISSSRASPAVEKKPRLRRPRQPTELAPSPTASATPAVHELRIGEREDQAIGLPLPGMSGRVSHAVINFDVFSGADRRLIASGEHRYVADRDGNFGVSIKQQPSGDGDAGLSHIEISGTIARQGLSPFLYETVGALAQRLLSITKGGDEATASKSGKQKWRMPDGIIDRQTLLYYFMFKPPELAGGKVLLSDGISYASFSYHIAGTEAFSIAALGEAHSLKLVFTSSESRETIELWVVPNLHYLPVKARYIDRQGGISEQVATAMAFD